MSDKKYFYCISEDDFEDYRESILVHDVKFNKEEFEALIQYALAKCEADDTIDDCFLADHIEEILKEQFGFNELSIQQGVHVDFENSKNRVSFF